MGKKPLSSKTLHRRHFIGNTLKLAALSSLLPLLEACNNKKTADTGNPGRDRDPKKPTHTKNLRKKWNHERLVMNTKSNVVHFPTSKVYKYYDPISSGHLQAMNGVAAIAALQAPARLNNEQSGNILEILAMAGLNNGISESSLATATDTLALAFNEARENKKGINPNMFNFRLHELMLQLIALNPRIAIADKWNTFNNKVRKPDQLRKRQKWMETEANFNQRVQYILDRQNDYTARLTKRASLYVFN